MPGEEFLLTRSHPTTRDLTKARVAKDDFLQSLEFWSMSRILPFAPMKSYPLHGAACWILIAALIALCGMVSGQEAAPKLPIPPPPGTKAPLPEDLLGDEHVREEFGVNQFTTPSIRKLFEMLDDLGKLSYEGLKRPIPKKTPTDRVQISLGLGSLIADGFLIVQCEKVEAMEDVGRALIRYAKVLGAGSRMNRHTQSLFDHSIDGDWDKLRTELALTQADVEVEMVQLQDVHIAHLVSLGGWVRAFEIASRSVAGAYSPEKSVRLNRPDILLYYLDTMENLPPPVKANGLLTSIRGGLRELLPLMGDTPGAPLPEAQTTALAGKAEALSTLIKEPLKN